MKRVVLFFLLVCVCGAGFAQDAPAKPARKKAKAAAEAGMPALKPSAELTRLAQAISGHYSVKMVLEPVMGMPGGTTTGKAWIRNGPGKLSLYETSSGVDDKGKKFTGMGMFWYDPQAAVFKGIWCDNETPTGCGDAGSGKWQGDKLIMTGTMDMGGKQFSMRHTYSNFNGEGFDYMMEVGPDANAMQKWFNIEYRKAEAAPKTETKPAATPGQ